MSAALIIQLLAQFGPSGITLVTQLISLIEANGAVTSAQWATMISGIAATTPQTEMAKELVAAGISQTDPRYLALIAATKPAGA